MVYASLSAASNSSINNRKSISNSVGNYDDRNYDFFFIMFATYLFVVKYYVNVKL